MANDTNGTNEPRILNGSVRGPADENLNAKVYTQENAHEMHGQFSEDQLQTLKDRGVISGNFEPKPVDLERDPTIRAGTAKDERSRGKGPQEGKKYVAGEEKAGDNTSHNK